MKVSCLGCFILTIRNSVLKKVYHVEMKLLYEKDSEADSQVLNQF